MDECSKKVKSMSFFYLKTTKEGAEMPRENTNCHLCGIKLKKKQYSFDEGISTFYGCICKKCDVTYLFLGGELVEGEAYKKYIDHINCMEEDLIIEKKIDILKDLEVNIAEYPLTNSSKLEEERVAEMLKVTPETMKKLYKNGNLTINQALILSKYCFKSLDFFFKLAKKTGDLDK